MRVPVLPMSSGHWNSIHGRNFDLRVCWRGESHDLLMCGWCALTGSLADLFGWMLVGMLSVAVLH
jgi:hypothetical protein